MAVVPPILEGVLYALKGDVVEQLGGHANIPLFMLARAYRAADRDCGICFEYAVHDALNRQVPEVTERVHDALANHCHVPGANISSILLGLEKAGALNLIDTAKERLTDDSRLMHGSRGQPARLKRHIDSIAAAFRKKGLETALPSSIQGLWKADLFVGSTDRDRWVGTTIKINPAHLEGAAGLRIGIVPAGDGQQDAIRHDAQRNLVVCPLPYDGAFVEVFYVGWQVVKLFLAADARVPAPGTLPRITQRQVAQFLADRRDAPVVEVIAALRALAQPELIETAPHDAELVSRRGDNPELETGAVVAPVPR